MKYPDKERKMKYISIQFVALALLALSASAPAATWKSDPAHTTVSFTVKHLMMTTVRGEFTTFDATVDFDENNPSTFSVNAEADAASVNTRSEKRDADLRSAKFFDVENTPKLSLVSKKVEKIDAGRYKMTADLTMHGITKEVVFDVTGFSGTINTPWGSTVTSATATATIDRKDWGLNWNVPLESGGVLVSDDVAITLDVELIKQDQN
jgi:polyisoprenoid-binding protein YceI